MKNALLLIDIQKDYFPGGKMELDGSVEAAQQASLLLNQFRAQGRPTVHIQHISLRHDASFFLPDTEGIEFHELITPQADEKVITKHFPNSFRETKLFEYLKSLDVENLTICGMMTHMCVDATTRAAVDLGFTTLVAEDACATRALTYHGTAIPAEYVHKSFLAALQSYGLVKGTDEILSGLRTQ